MKILVLGGGPGGLYAAILLKKANPAHAITIVERNPAGATYGWGVVFSDRTIATFREADFPTFERIAREFVTWTAIDVHYRGEVIRADGHDFAGMSRKRLLQILQERCRELGVELVFEREAVIIEKPGLVLSEGEGSKTGHQVNGVEVFPILPGDYDLVIAADGVNSATRAKYAATFQPTLTIGKARFIWFGTNRLLDAFTFIIRENEHGLFQVHAYPFDGSTSTFIVETTNETWRRAGLAEASEAESIATCRELFADFLGPAELLSNRSMWVNFTHVACKTWRHDADGTPIVLLGDSAHTAHFSIGSGTKLAMDAAISLAQAIEAAPDLNAAIRLYQMDRRPRVEGLQAAALTSQEYFENLQRFTRLDPQPFAFQLLTRSGRIHYDNLRTRDPRYADEVDRSFAGMPHAPPPMYAPFTLRGLTLPNRIVSRRAGSGAGLVLTPPVAVAPGGRVTAEDPVLWEEDHIADWQDWVAAAHAAGARAGILLNHAGRRAGSLGRQRGTARPAPQRAGWHGEPTDAASLPHGGSPQPVAASPIPDQHGSSQPVAASPLLYHRGSPMPREAGPEDLAAICDAFVRAARLAERAGFDLLQLHMAHGYLLAGFLSPLSNQRTDEYGADRARFSLEVFAAVRREWDGPLAAALNVDDWAKGGLGLAEAIEIGRALKAHGCDLLQPLAGQTVPDDNPVYGVGYLTGYAETLRHEVGLPVLVGGFLRTSGEVNTILAGGRGDLCILNF